MRMMETTRSARMLLGDCRRTGAAQALVGKRENDSRVHQQRSAGGLHQSVLKPRSRRTQKRLVVKIRGDVSGV